MTTPIPPGMRAEFDRELEGATRGLIAQAAEYDHLDLIEANVALTNDLFANFTAAQLAASASMLALRIHRGGTDG